MQMLGLRRANPTINLSALVDVLFILIVFVILAADFDHTRAIDIELPGSSTGRAVSEAELQLLVPQKGSMRLGGQPVTEGELQARLALARGTRSVLLIVADGDVPLGRATRIIEAGTRAGFATVSLATQQVAP